MRSYLAIAILVCVLCAASCQMQTKQTSSSQSNIDLLNMLMSSSQRLAKPKPQPMIPTMYPIRRTTVSPWSNFLMRAYLLDNMGIDMGLDFNLFE